MTRCGRRYDVYFCENPSGGSRGGLRGLHPPPLKNAPKNRLKEIIKRKEKRKGKKERDGEGRESGV